MHGPFPSISENSDAEEQTGWHDSWERAGAAAAAAVVARRQAGGRAMSRAEPTRLAPGPGTPAPSPAAPAVEGRVATTIRLHPAAAAALNSTWLHQRMHVNPRLSYPEFASEIVQLGLAAFERQAKQPLPAVARAGSTRDDHGRIPGLAQRRGSCLSVWVALAPRWFVPHGGHAGLSPMGDIGGRQPEPPRELADAGRRRGHTPELALWPGSAARWLLRYVALADLG